VAGNTRKQKSVKKSYCRIGKTPGGVTSTYSKGFSGYKEVVQSVGRSFQSVRQGGDEIAGCWERASSVRYRRGWGVVKGARGDSGQGDKLALFTLEKEGGFCCMALVKAENLSSMMSTILGPFGERGPEK
jgi:hypothetical protein